MSENINISFIPKKPLARKEVLRKKPFFGISFIVSLTVTLVSIGFATSGYFALKTVKQEKETVMRELDIYVKQLKEEKDEQGHTLLEKIDEEREFVQRANIAKVVLDNHVAPSKIFTYLEDTTPTEVSYNNFSYNKSEDTVTISMRGSVRSYGLLAALSKWYKSQSNVIKELTFGDFTPGDNSSISFSFQGVLYPKLISYEEKNGNTSNNSLYKMIDDSVSDNVENSNDIGEKEVDNSKDLEELTEEQPDEQLDM